MEATENSAPKSFDIEDIDAADEGTMHVFINGKDTGWIWVFAGPGHKRTIEQSNKIAREQMNRAREQDEAVVNGRRWKAEVQTPEESHARSVGIVVDRLLGWHLVNDKGEKTGAEVKMAGQPFPFSVENARKILDDRRKGSVLIQALQYLNSETAFTKPLANK